MPDLGIHPIVYREGWEAAVNGKHAAANPYDEDGDLARAAAWLRGYEDVMWERAKDASALNRTETL